MKARSWLSGSKPLVVGVEHDLPLSVPVPKDLLQAMKHAPGSCRVVTRLSYSLNAGDLPGYEPIGLDDIAIKPREASARVMIGKRSLRHVNLPAAGLSAILWLAPAACLMPWDNALPVWDPDRGMLAVPCTHLRWGWLPFGLRTERCPTGRPKG